MKKTALIALFSCLVGTTAHAQSPNFHGNWTCEVVASQTYRNQAPANIIRNFQLMVQPGAQASFAGTEIAYGRTFPFDGQGEWQFDGTHFNLVGRMRGGFQLTQSMELGIPAPQGADQFLFFARPQTESFMAGENQNGNPNTGIFRIMTQCQR